MRIIRFQESYSSRRHKGVTSIYRKMMIAIILIVASLLTILLFYFKASWIAIIFVASIFFLSTYLNKDRKEIREIMRLTGVGAQGEERVLKQLQTHLGDEYVYISNYVLPNTMIGDIDGMLIGPKGLIVIEIKTWHGQFKITCGEIYRRFGLDIFKLYKSPFTQVENQVEALGRFFKQHNISLHIRPLIVLVGGSIFQIKGNTGIYVVTDHNLVRFIEELPNESLTFKRRETILRAMRFSLED